jgi:hypothetical protein
VKEGIVAEFENSELLVRAITELRRRGYRGLDTLTPYPSKEVDAALGADRYPIKWLVLPVWAMAAAGAYLVQWYSNTYEHPLDIGGRTRHSVLAFIPITFEMGVLATALGAIVFFLVLAGLPELHSPMFGAEDFDQATDDRFYLGVDARDPVFDAPQLFADLSTLGATRVSFAGAATP